MNIFESIIAWSKSLKPWEQEAVRRLVVKRKLTKRHTWRTRLDLELAL